MHHKGEPYKAIRVILFLLALVLRHRFVICSWLTLGLKWSRFRNCRFWLTGLALKGQFRHWLFRRFGFSSHSLIELAKKNNFREIEKDSLKAQQMLSHTCFFCSWCTPSAVDKS